MIMEMNIDFRTNNTIPNTQTDHKAYVCLVVVVFIVGSNETE